MDMNEVRRQNLTRLIAKEFGHEKGAQASFAAAHDVSDGRLSQLLSVTYRDGQGFGEKAARALEKKIGQPSMWLDQTSSSVRLVASNSTHRFDEMIELLNLFEGTDDQSRSYLLDAAREMPKKNPLRWGIIGSQK